MENKNNFEKKNTVFGNLRNLDSRTKLGMVAQFVFMTAIGVVSCCYEPEHDKKEVKEEQKEVFVESKPVETGKTLEY